MQQQAAKEAAAMTCFSSEDPRALDASQVISLQEDSGALWRRSSPEALLPLCSSSTPPADSRCLLCVDQTVRVVCRNLTAQISLEAPGEEVEVRRSGCPTLLSDDAEHWKLPVIIVCTLFLFLMAAAFLVYRKRYNNKRENSDVEEGEVEGKGEEEEPFTKPQETNGDSHHL